jgi:hypothetical protein
MYRSLTNTTDTGIQQYMFGNDKLAHDRFNNYSIEEKNAYMVGYLASALKNAHQKLNIIKGEK